MSNQPENGVRSVSHLTLVITMIVFTMVIIAFNILLKWESWIILVLVSLLALSLIMYVTEMPSSGDVLLFCPYGFRL